MIGGAAQKRITPQRPLPLWGYGNRRGESQGVYDDLFAKVVVLNTLNKAGTGSRLRAEKPGDLGDVREPVSVSLGPPRADDPLMLVMLDLGGISREISDAIKHRLARAVHIPEIRIALCVTHTHAAPAMTPFRGIAIDEEYVGYVSDRIVEGARQAVAEMTEVRVSYAQFDCHLSVNRRDRGVTSDPGQPSGTVDPIVSLVRIDRPHGQPLAILINYAMHPVTLRADNRFVSADYPGVACRVVAREVPAIVGFLQGCAGDVNPKLWGSRTDTERVGQALGREVLEHLAGTEVVADARVAAAAREVLLPVRNIDRESVRKRIARYQSGELPRNDLWSRCDYQWALQFDRYCQTANAPRFMISIVQAAALGQLRLVFLPGEPLTSASLAIRRQFSDAPLIVSAYANDTSIGYIPGKAAADSGGYEVDEAFKFYGLFPLGCEAEAAILDACGRTLEELESGQGLGKLA